VGTGFADKSRASDEIDGRDRIKRHRRRESRRNSGENGNAISRIGPAYVPMPASSVYFTLLNYIRPFQI